MSSSLRISLRAGERLFINGAVLRASQRTTLELLNEANFLLEAHVIQADEATTPLRQLYFALQTLLIDPSSETARDAYLRMHVAASETFSTTDVVAGLRVVARLADAGRTFEALRTIRNLFAVERDILKARPAMAAKVA